MARRGRTQDDLFDHGQTYGRSSRAGVDFESWREPLSSWRAQIGGSKLLFDVITGLIAGAAAAWVMTQYQINSNKFLKKFESSVERSSQASEQQSSSQNTTVKVADRISRAVRGREVSEEHKELAGNLVHYSFGMINGALFGILSKHLPLRTPLRGVMLGAGVWAAADELLVPALGFSQWWPEYPTSTHLKGLGAHLVYGASLDTVDFGLRELMRSGQQIAEQTRGLKESLRPKEESAEFRRPAAQPRSTHVSTRRFSRADLGEAA